MKQFLIWLAIIFLLFVGVSVYYHITLIANSYKIFVGVDVSGYMDDVKLKIPSQLSYLTGKMYTQYTLATNRSKKSERMIHSWQPELQIEEITNIKMFSNLDLKVLLDFPEIKEADEIIIISNAKDVSMLQGFGNLGIVRIH